MSRLSSRRRFVGGLLSVAVLSLSGRSFAGSYLNRASLIVRQARQEGEYLRARLDDVELARTIRDIAEGRLSAARRTVVPKEVAQAHPHLLLMLEHYERAADAAVERRAAASVALNNRARDEEQIFRGILRQLGWPLPD